MDFAIEAPGEANPLTTQTLLHILQSASSNDRQQITSGTEQLQNWEKTPGFYSGLQSIYMDYSLPTELRYIAIIKLKNGVDKYWRKTALNAIKKEEKELIRTRSIESGVVEPDHRLALQISIATAKICRYEFPQDWPDVMETVLEKFHSASATSSNPVYLHRVVTILLYIVKELSTARIQRSRTSLQNVAPDIVRSLSIVYNERYCMWVNLMKSRTSDEGEALKSMEHSLIILRVLRRLIIAGYDFPNRSLEIQQIWGILATHFGELLALVQGNLSNLGANSQYLVDKHLFQIGKLHVDMVKSRPTGYALLPNSTGLAREYWGLARQYGETLRYQTPTVSAKVGTDGDADPNEKILVQEKLTLKGLLLIRACMKMVFNPAQTFKFQKDEDKEEKKLSKDLMKNELLSGSFAREAMETLVMRFFVFTSRDLRAWEEEPDEWEKTQESGGDDWEFSLRSCSEKLFLDLLINYKDLLIEPLLNVFTTVATLQNTDILLKDSIYGAIGLAAPVLDRSSDFDFGQFLSNTLVHEIQIQQPGYNIIRRRAAIVIGQWMPVKKGLNSQLIYQIFQHLLDNGNQLNDQVVRITAGRQFANVVETFEFSDELFRPYAPTILTRLMAMIEEVDLIETKKALLHTVMVIVVKMEKLISPFANQIVSLLSPLWDQAGEQYEMKAGILNLLSALGESMGAAFQRYYSLVVPLLQTSLEPSSKTRTYFLEPAILLWQTILERSPSPASPEVVSLVKYLFPLFEDGSDVVPKALAIAELYIYLIPSEFLSNAALILNPLTSLLQAVRAKNSGTVTSLLELLIRSAHSIGGISAVEELTGKMHSSNILDILFSSLLDAYDAHQTTGPNSTQPSIDGLVETDYFNVIARLAIASPSLLISALEAVVSRTQIESLKPAENPIDRLLTEWFSHMDNIGHPAHKKLNCMALTSLLATGQPWILNRLQSLMTVWTDVITEIVTDVSHIAGTEELRDCLVITDSDALEMKEESATHECQRLLKLEEPVYTMDIRDFVRGKLGIAIEGCGGVEIFQRDWVQNVDEDVGRAFGTLGVV